MPTGYTAGIIDGSINTFEEFAKGCARAFGALIMMKEDPMDTPIKLREPIDYYVNQINDIRNNKAKLIAYTDDELETIMKDLLIVDIKQCEEQIAKITTIRSKLGNMLIAVKNWTPPTEEHTHFKEFMDQQLMDTLKCDGNAYYYVEKLAKSKYELDHIDVKSYRAIQMHKLDKDLAYNVDQRNKDLERCKDSNKWITDLLDSLKD